VVDSYCDDVGIYTVTYSVDNTEGISEDLLAELDKPLDTNILELPSNSLKADRIYVFTATVN